MIILLLLSSFFALSSQNEEFTNPINNSIYYFTHWGWNLASLIVSSFIVLVALYGDFFKGILLPIKFDILENKIIGFKIENNSDETVNYKNEYEYFYDLTIINKSRFVKAENVRVLLTKIAFCYSNNDTKEYALNRDTQFRWSPSDVRPELINIALKNKIEYGKIGDYDKTFKPILYRYYDTINLEVKKDEVKRYEIKIIADNCFKEYYKYYEVSYIDNISSDSLEMNKNLTIKEV